MRRNREWDSEYDDYREFKKPKRIEKDKFHKHKKAVYDLMSDEEDFDEEYFDEAYRYEDVDEEL